MAKDGRKVEPVDPLDLLVEKEMPGPWYQYVDWWEGMSSAQVASKVVEACREASAQGSGGWVVVPWWYPNPAAPVFVSGLSLSDNDLATLNQPGAVVRVEDTAVRLLARDTYLELVRRQGYSPQHAVNAWDSARAFEREGRKEEAE